MMKHTRCFLQILLALCLAALLTVPLSVANSEESLRHAEAVFDGILDSYLKESGRESVQSWIDETLAHNPASGEWTAFALLRRGEWDFTAYGNSLLAYLENTEIHSASSRLKYALLCHFLGIGEEWVAAAADESVGEQGVISLVYGLHLATAGVTSSSYTAEALCTELLSCQHEDGGWSVMGTVSDVDVTAMAIQALAPYAENETVRAAIDCALTLLSDRQTETGDFISYGQPNPESAAQVLIALSTLEIDSTSDERFLKNGVTLFDVIAKYRLPNGLYAHTEGGNANANATSQVLCAMTAVLRMVEGKTPFYVLEEDFLWPDPETAPSSEESEAAESEKSTESPVSTVPETESSAPKAPKTTVPSPKVILCCVVLILGLGCCVVLFVTGKRNPKNFAVTAAATLLALAAVLLVEIQSADDYYTGTTKANAIGTVTITIRCDTVAGVDENAPADGIILPPTEMDLAAGDTVYTILTEAARAYGIQLENNGTQDLAYLVGIAYIYEAAHGDLSGWLYRVNGDSPSVGCGQYVLSPNDEIVWYYSLEMGEDWDRYQNP